MTRKDYELIAGIVSTIPDDKVRHDVAYQFACKLRFANHRFDPDTFYRACGVLVNKEKINLQAGKEPDCTLSNEGVTR